MPELRLISKSFIEPNILEKIFLTIAKERDNNVIKSSDSELSYEIQNRKTKNVFSITILNREEFINSISFFKNKLGVIAQINFSNKVEEEDLDQLMLPFIKDLVIHFPEILIDQYGNTQYTIEEFIKLNED